MKEIRCSTSEFIMLRPIAIKTKRCVAIILCMETMSCESTRTTGPVLVSFRLSKSRFRATFRDGYAIGLPADAIPPKE